MSMKENSFIFECDKITKDFGGLRALVDLSFKVLKKEIIGIMGPNGAGKTTLFNVISGAMKRTSGSFRLNGIDITNYKAHMICRLGIGRTYQTVRPFLGFSVLENTTVGVLFGKGKENISRKMAEEKAGELIRFVGLQGKEKALAKNLNLIERKKVELARTLATNPVLILLDEILSGLPTSELEASMLLINRIRDELGITIIWIEHIMKALMGVCERIIVLDNGVKIAEGTPKNISLDPNVNEVYFGRKRKII